MLSRRLRPYAWMILVAALLLAVYAAMAVAAVASLSGAPNYPGNARREARVWEAVFVGAIAFVGLSTFVIVVTRQPQSS